MLHDNAASCLLTGSLSEKKLSEDMVFGLYQIFIELIQIVPIGETITYKY